MTVVERFYVHLLMPISGSARISPAIRAWDFFRHSDFEGISLVQDDLGRLIGVEIEDASKRVHLPLIGTGD